VHNTGTTAYSLYVHVQPDLLLNLESREPKPKLSRNEQEIITMLHRNDDGTSSHRGVSKRAGQSNSITVIDIPMNGCSTRLKNFACPFLESRPTATFYHRQHSLAFFLSLTALPTITSTLQLPRTKQALFSSLTVLSRPFYFHAAHMLRSYQQ
jgi:hypothetical protein